MNQNGFSQNPYSGFNNNPPITQQPHFDFRRQTTLRTPFDYKWHEKPSPNGEFKYGLCQCCSGPSSSTAILAIIMSCIPVAGCCITSSINGKVAEVVVCHLCSTLQMRNEIAYTRDEVMDMINKEAQQGMQYQAQMYALAMQNNNTNRVSPK